MRMHINGQISWYEANGEISEQASGHLNMYAIISSPIYIYICTICFIKKSSAFAYKYNNRFNINIPPGSALVT